MAQGDSGNLHWRETFFVLFEARHRPTLAEVEHRLRRLSDRYELSQGLADEQGRFESLAVASRDDRVVLEISFESGAAVRDQAEELAADLKKDADREQLALLRRADARLDIMHFEQLTGERYGDEDDDDIENEMVDPSCLLSTVDVLVSLTGGIPIDPASGAILP